MSDDISVKKSIRFPMNIAACVEVLATRERRSFSQMVIVLLEWAIKAQPDKDIPDELYRATLLRVVGEDGGKNPPLVVESAEEVPEGGSPAEAEKADAERERLLRELVASDPRITAGPREFKGPDPKPAGKKR